MFFRLQLNKSFIYVTQNHQDDTESSTTSVIASAVMSKLITVAAMVGCSDGVFGVANTLLTSAAMAGDRQAWLLLVLPLFFAVVDARLSAGHGAGSLRRGVPGEVYEMGLDEIVGYAKERSRCDESERLVS